MHCVSSAVVRLLLHQMPGTPHRNGLSDSSARCCTRSMPALMLRMNSARSRASLPSACWTTRTWPMFMKGYHW